MEDDLEKKSQDLENLEENLIAIVIDKNNNNVTIIM